MKSNNTFELAIGGAIILLMVVFIWNLVFNRSNNEYIAGKNITVAGGVFSNDAGAINHKFKGADIYEIETDPEGKVAVFRYEKDVYFVNSDLKIELIDRGCSDISMNYAGDYVYIASTESSKFGRGLCAYDVTRKQYRLIKNCNIRNYNSITSSPDGNSVLVSRSDGMFIMGPDGEEQKINSGLDFYYVTLAISNDRSVAFFSNYAGGIMCWTPDKLKYIYTSDFTGYTAVDSDCKKIVFYVYKEPKGELYYFDSETMDRGKSIAPGEFSMYLKGEKCLHSYEGSFYYPNVDSFEGMAIKDNGKMFWLNADMDILNIGEVSDPVYSHGENKLFYKEENDIVSATYKDKKNQLDKIYHSDEAIKSFTVSDDNSSLWIALDKKIVKYEAGVEKEVFAVEDDRFGYKSIINDPLTDNIYCITENGNTYLLNEESGATLVKKTRKGDFLKFSYNTGKAVISITSQGEEHHNCILFGKIINVD